MKTPNTTQIAIYSRKSKFTGKGESIENQIELCREYIRSSFDSELAETAIVFEDEGFSGGNLERPQFKNMMRAAHKGKLSAIVVYRLDRISRNIGDFAKLIDELSALKISFISIREQFDTSSPMGRAMMYIASVFSQLERETIAERIRDNMHELAKTGRWLGGMTPTGYCSQSVEKVIVDGKSKKACMLQLVPEEAQLVTLIFNKFLETHSLSKTDTYLLQNGYHTKTRRKFTRFSIKGILTNPVYMIADTTAYQYFVSANVSLFSDYEEFNGTHGIMAYNRTSQQTGKTNQLNPMSEWIVSIGRHQGFIQAQKWIDAQQLLARNRDANFRKPRSNTALLSGLLKCGCCGDYLRPKPTGRKDDQGVPQFIYLCSMKERSKRQCCAISNVKGNQLDSAVFSYLNSFQENRQLLITELKHGQNLLTPDPYSNGTELEKQQEFVTQKQAEIRLLTATLAKATGTAAEKYILEQINVLHNQIELLQREIRNKSVNSQNINPLFSQTILSLCSFCGTLDLLPIEQKRNMLRAVIREIVWDGTQVHLYWLGSEEEYPSVPQKTLGEDSK